MRVLTIAMFTVIVSIAASAEAQALASVQLTAEQQAERDQIGRERGAVIGLYVAGLTLNAGGWVSVGMLLHKDFDDWNETEGGLFFTFLALAFVGQLSLIVAVILDIVSGAQYGRHLRETGQLSLGAAPARDGGVLTLAGSF